MGERTGFQKENYSEEKSIPARQTGKHLLNTIKTSPSVSTSTVTVSLVSGGPSTRTNMAEPVEANASTFQGNSRKKTVTFYDVPAYTGYSKSAPVLNKGIEEGQSIQPLTFFSMAESLTKIHLTLSNGSTAELKETIYCCHIFS